MRTQPDLGLRRFIATIAATSCAAGPLGPGLWRCGEEEKSRRYFRSTSALWNLSRVAGLTSVPSFAMRRRLTNSVVSPSRKRSIEVRFGARCLERLAMSNWCFSISDSAATARLPPRRRSFTQVTSKVDGEDEEVAHGANGTTTASARKTAPHRRIPSYYEFASHRRGRRRVVTNATSANTKGRMILDPLGQAR